MSIFFFGGSFDPPHIGHLQIIEACFKKFDVKKFILIPTKQSPLKHEIPIAASFHRIQMLKLLINNLKQNIIIDDFEITGATPSYTYETIKHLKAIYPNCHLSMIIGEDQLICFNKWRNYRKINEAVKIIVFNRLENNNKSIEDKGILRVSDFHVDISSTSIRNIFSIGHSPINELTTSVHDYIVNNKLYDLDA